MSELFGILDVARRAMFVSQSGIRTTSHNIANANTPGYSRQRQVLEAARPIAHPAGQLGTGVVQRSIERVTDEFLHGQLMREQAGAGSTDAQAAALAQIEEVLNEQQVGGIGAALSRLYDAFGDLASATAPGAPVEREAVRAAAEGVIDAIGRADARLRDLQRQTDRSIRGAVAEVNELLEGIARLDREIVAQETVAPANDLRDQREELLRQLAGTLEVSTFEQANGSVVVLMDGGLPLVEGGVARRLELEDDTGNPFDASFARVVYADGANRVDVTGTASGGELGGLLRVRDSALPAAIRSLDSVAYNLAVQVNAVHSAGVGLDGSVGDFFQAPAAVEDAARDLALDPNVAASPDAIAAGLGSDPGDNRNALVLADLRTTAAPLFLPGDPPGPASGPTRTVLDHFATVVADVGQQSRLMQQTRSQQQQVLEVIENRRDEISGVSIDEEVTNLIRLQAAFQANARIVSVVDRLVQDVLEML